MGRKKIDDGLDPSLSRQRRYQLRKRKEQKCQQCGASPLFTKDHCERCVERRRAAARKKTGCRPWVKGGRGRPPVEHALHPDDAPTHEQP